MKPTNSIRIKPIIAVLCDDIREEKNGKSILIGLYTGGITVNRPKDIPLDSALTLNVCIWMPFEFETKEIGSANLEFEIVMPDQHEMGAKVGISYEVLPAKNEISVINLMGIPLPISKSGNININFRHEGDDEWTCLRSISLTVREQ